MSIYIGPYLLIKEKIVTETNNKQIIACSNMVCPNYMIESKIEKGYCSSCGSVLTEHIREQNINTEVSPFHFFQTLDSFDEQLAQISQKTINDELWYIVVSNKGKIKGTHYIENNYRSDRYVIPLTLEYQDIKENFNQIYEKEIMLLIEYFGEQNIVYEYGIVVY